MLRYLVFLAVLVLTVSALVIGLVFDAQYLWALAVLAPLCGLGLWDLFQGGHSLLRNYPVIGHMRWAFEGIRPEIRQYLIESDEDAVPFNREQRSIVYQRAKNQLDKQPFGTKLDVREPGYAWLAHSLAACEPDGHDFRVEIGGPQCARPFAASVYNISAMSFGSLGAQAVRALNKGASLGGFAQDTGEGGISRHHREFGGDLIWEIGSGYYGCRGPDGRFDPEAFARQAADAQVKMIEIKLSQGAKPGHGGVLPAAKISVEIAEARGVPQGDDCISPPGHSAFSTPLELTAFIAELRELSGGKPVGMKLCIGHRWEFLAVAKAMIESGITPDFIVVDGTEGGTGAAPLEFANHIGTPMTEGLVFVRNVLIATGLRERIRIAAAGKLVTAFDLAQAMALGADWCNAARGFMFALGCIQSQKCHTNACPVGVATQDPLRQRALVVEDKAHRVANFQRNTLQALAEVVAAAGLAHPAELSAGHIFLRGQDGSVLSLAEHWPAPAPGALLDGDPGPDLADDWRRARADSFAPAS